MTSVTGKIKHRTTGVSFDMTFTSKREAKNWARTQGVRIVGWRA